MERKIDSSEILKALDDQMLYLLQDVITYCNCRKYREAKINAHRCLSLVSVATSLDLYGWKEQLKLRNSIYDLIHTITNESSLYE